ncbi:hypothetical protein CES86_2158 [Brucella lupini]|uniref:Uncharacterized protein n=1 Tax=Brucella lupini TaxID=255457 RepID=A0A256GQY8_9HYPH|nr:hypothetical protein CES86_2158 [Brucella lupini]
MSFLVSRRDQNERLAHQRIVNRRFAEIGIPTVPLGQLQSRPVLF